MRQPAWFTSGFACGLGVSLLFDGHWTMALGEFALALLFVVRAVPVGRADA